MKPLETADDETYQCHGLQKRLNVFLEMTGLKEVESESNEDISFEKDLDAITDNMQLHSDDDEKKSLANSEDGSNWSGNSSTTQE